MASILAIFIVILIITGSLILSTMTIFSVLVLDLFLVALIPLWNLTFNNIVVVHMVASLGISVLYSVHISYTFLHTEPTIGLNAIQERRLKTRVALSQIGSSVLHGSITTLLTVAIVGIFAHKSYYFIVFFKVWLGIVLFCMANAFLLTPVLLSFFGPTLDFDDIKSERHKGFLKRM